MKQKITLKNIYSFLEGNTQMILDGLNMKELWYQEQIAYRKLKCEDCWTKRACQHCGCKLPGRWYTSQSCDKERFPDLIGEEEWKIYKIENEIR